MLDILWDNSSENAEYLVNVVKTLKITYENGKNFKTVVSLVHGAFIFLRNLVGGIGQIVLSEKFLIISSMYLRPPQLPNSTHYLLINPSLLASMNFRLKSLTNHASVIFYHWQKHSIATFF